MYVRNCWYVAGWARELANGPIAGDILEQPVVVFRTASGTLTALEDHCPHRHLKLSMGQVEGETIQCGYHGMRIGVDGRCAHVPGQKAVPPRARVRCYPVVERYGWIWIWTGDADLADPALIPDFHQLTDPGLATVGGTNLVKANYRLLNDNLLDLSHVGFVHTSTIGTREYSANATITAERIDGGVQVTRWVIDCPPPPTYVKTGHLPAGKNIDRWSIVHYTAPSFVVIHTGGAEAGTGAPEGKLGHGIDLWVLNAMTPQDEKTTHYFWSTARNFRTDDSDTDDLVFAQVSEAFDEDKRVLEAQQIAIDRHGDDWSNALQGDAGAIEGRRCLERLLNGEARVPAVRRSA